MRTLIIGGAIGGLLALASTVGCGHVDKPARDRSIPPDAHTQVERNYTIHPHDSHAVRVTEWRDQWGRVCTLVYDLDNSALSCDWPLVGQQYPDALPEGQ